MDIIIPLGGKGERFRSKNYEFPKPLIKVGNKEMICHVIDNLTISENDTVSIFFYNVLETTYNFSSFIHHRYPKIKLISIDFQTRGALETVYTGFLIQQQMYKIDGDNERKCLLVDCDAFYTEDIVSLAKKETDNAVFVINDDEVRDRVEKPKYSYVSVNDQKQVLDIVEKSRITSSSIFGIKSFANTGAYLFKNRRSLLAYAQKVLEDDFRFCNEFYTSCVIKYMLNNKHKFKAIEIPKSCFISLGTPEQVNKYLEFRHGFLFDLDGTLVDTTKLYLKVWKKLLEPFNIDVNDDFFEKYISGNNDQTVIQMLLPNLSEEEINDVSNQKDLLFLEFLNEIKIIEGALVFLKNVKRYGHPIGIVTNCNRITAEKIISHFQFGQYVDILVIGNECEFPKPHASPYRKAKELLQCKEVIIFEDSGSGFLSARGISPKCLVAINSHNYSKEVFDEYGADLIINNFLSIPYGIIPELLSVTLKNNLKSLEQKIIESISQRYPSLKEVIVLTNKLKGGYIADVIRINLVMNDGNIIECVAKLQSENQNHLSNTASELELYNREQYFYEVIRDHLKIKAPRYFGSIRDGLRPIGVLLEYLPHSDYHLNLNLEKESIDVTLLLVKRIASHHARFWNKDLIENFRQLKKNDDATFSPTWTKFVETRWPNFKEKWKIILSENQIMIGESIVERFSNIQKYLSEKPLTLCHGDVKSPNIFFQKHTFEPYFIDWQYIVAGKGVQDLVFLMIESFSSSHIKKIGKILKEYYYISLIEHGVTNYSAESFEKDFQASICYFPFFVAIWFGTTSSDQLIDTNFPFFFIRKLFSFIDNFLDSSNIIKLENHC
jgi:beta-phosphoglucomutase-like phosphatase (HAD superfamily)/choline kinase